jgi:hypothetical protein
LFWAVLCVFLSKLAKSAHISTTFFWQKFNPSINIRINRSTYNKSQYLVFHHFFIENFFHMNILQLFQRVQNQHLIFAFFIAIFNFSRKIIFLLLLALVEIFKEKRTRNCSKKLKTFFINVSYNKIPETIRKVVKLVVPYL